MKSLNIAVIVSTALMLVAGVASAESPRNAQHQNFSKRPYHQPLPDSAYQKTNEFEGATLVRGEANEDKSVDNKHQELMRINQLSKRPY